MAKGLVEQGSLTAIADAIREKNGSNLLYTPATMPQAIKALNTGIIEDVSQYFTNTDLYDISIINCTSSSGLKTSDLGGISLDKVVVLFGSASVTEASNYQATARSSATPLIYIPTLYNVTKDYNGMIAHSCVGYYVGSDASGHREIKVGVEIGGVIQRAPITSSYANYKMIPYIYTDTDNIVNLVIWDFATNRWRTTGNLIAGYGSLLIVSKKGG